jgi:hypothetical protein
VFQLSKLFQLVLVCARLLTLLWVSRARVRAHIVYPCAGLSARSRREVAPLPFSIDGCHVVPCPFEVPQAAGDAVLVALGSFLDRDEERVAQHFADGDARQIGNEFADRVFPGVFLVAFFLLFFGQRGEFFAVSHQGSPLW